MELDAVHLEYKEGSSNKVYNAALTQEGVVFLIKTSWGRRGSALSAGSKGPFTSRAEADVAFKKLVGEKTSKGYTAPGGAVPVLEGASDKRDTGLRPQLLNDLDESLLSRFLADDRWQIQPKHDGRRLLVTNDGGLITGANRKGEEIPLQEETLQAAMQACPWGKTILDGELVGNTYFVFDVLMWDGVDVKAQGYHDRYLLLHKIQRSKHLEVVTGSVLPDNKAKIFKKLQLASAEGVVFKNLSAPYTPGRPASGGPQLKYKFWHDADVIVKAGPVGKRSVGMAVVDGIDEHLVGNVTIPANYELPQPGQVAKVRYLYAFRGGSLFQPQFEGVRDDRDPLDCTIMQLHYKAEGADEDA